MIVVDAGIVHLNTVIGSITEAAGDITMKLTELPIQAL